MKVERQAKILELISNHDIETQEELADKLKEAGFFVTQATVSRDIKELKLTKLPLDGNRQIYSFKKTGSLKDNDVVKRFITVFKETTISMDYAGNLLVIKTLEGMGMAVAVALDNMENLEIVGTIAGDDTVFCAMKSQQSAVALIKKLKSLMKE